MRDSLIADKADVLVVDDQLANLQFLVETLSADYVVHPFLNGRGLFAYLDAGHPVDLILLDIVMPQPDGLQICRMLRTRPELADIPIVFLTSLSTSADEEAGLAAGAIDYIAKPFSVPVVRARVHHHIMLSRAVRIIQDMNGFLEETVNKRTAELKQKSQEVERTQEATIQALAALMEARDDDTGHHIHRTQHYIRELAEAAREHAAFRGQIDDAFVRMVFRSAALHDIGKVAIPDAILMKPGRLSTEEFEVMKTHTTHGRDAIANAEHILGSADSFLACAHDIAYSHHERWNGKGYPQGLAGEQIPLSARLMAIADVYDALISPRAYKAGMPHDHAVDLLLAGRGTDFDPNLIDVFARIHDRFASTARGFADTNFQEL
jgi:putative two-component system response regulator